MGFIKSMGIDDKLAGMFGVSGGAGVPGSGSFGKDKSFFWDGKTYTADMLTDDQKASLEAGVNPFDGSAISPNYIGMDTGEIRDAYGAITKDNRALDAFNKDALRTGPSKGASLAMEQNREDSLLGIDSLQRGSAGATAQARSGLAMKGGLSGGAAERIAKSGRDNLVQGIQGVNANAAKLNANIGMEDEKSRMGNLAQANTMNQAGSEFGLNKTNALYGQLAGESGRQNAFNANKYQSYMQAWGAGKQADATANAGKK